MLVRLLFAASAVAIVGAHASSAATMLHYNLEGNDSLNYNQLGESFPLTDEGVTATFTARSFTDVGFGGNEITFADLATSPPHIGRYPYGAGVVNAESDGSHTVDGTGWKDFIEVSLSKDVILSSISFGYYDTSDDFRWMYDSNEDGVIGVGDFISDAFSVAANNPFSDFGGIKTSLFAVGAFNDTQTCQKEEYEWYRSNGRWKKRKVITEYECNKADSWKLKTVNAMEPEVVPLPAAGLLLIGALGGFAALRRTKA